MHFVEVAVQHVRGFSAQGRFALKPGYLVLKPPTAEISPLAGLALALLYSDGRGGDAGFVTPGQKVGKAAFTLVGQDGITYRLLRELGGSGSLHRQNPSTQQPERLTQDSSEIAQYLRGQVGLPPRSTFEKVCCLMPSQLPSRRPRSRPASVPGADPRTSKPSLNSLASIQAVAPAEDIPAAEAKVRALEQELVKAREVDQLQFKLDGLNSQLFDVESKLKSTEGLKVALRDAEAAWQGAPTPEALGVPADIVARVERYPKVMARKEEALARVAAEREAEAQSAPASVEPLTKNQIFLAGVGAGTLLLLLGLILRLTVDSRLGYLALLDIPAFGVAALMALRYVDGLQKSSQVGRKEGMFAAREKKIREEFEAEVSVVHKALKVLQVESLEEIAPLLERKELLGQKVAELRAQLESLESSPDFMQAASQRDEIKQQIEALSAELSQPGTYVREAREVERELSRVKESIALARSGSAAIPAGGPGEPLEDPSPGVLALAADIFSTDISGVQGTLRDRCVQYLTALTDRRYQGIEWDREGKAFALAPGKRTPVGELPPKDVDLYYLALRMTVVEKANTLVKLPFLLDNPFAGMDEAKLPLLARMLKHLGTLTQVLHVTPHPGFAQMSDATINV